jgi:hypothetical protein
MITSECKVTERMDSSLLLNYNEARKTYRKCELDIKFVSAMFVGNMFHSDKYSYFTNYA